MLSTWATLFLYVAHTEPSAVTQADSNKLKCWVLLLISRVGKQGYGIRLGFKAQLQYLQAV